MHHRTSATRPWLLRAATAALVFVFAAPACFTMQLWKDDRSSEERLPASATPVHVFRLPDASGCFVLQVPQAIRGHLHV